MAYDVQVIGLPEHGDTELWRIEAGWWPCRELWAELKFEDVSWCEGYTDSQVDLSLPEALALHERFKGCAYGGMLQSVEALEQKLAAASPPSRVRILIEEWESGL